MGTGAVGVDENERVFALPAEAPWYRSPGAIVGIALVAILLLGGLAWLIFGGGDDDDDADLARLELTAVDVTGAGLERGFIGTVEGPADAPAAFEWVLPGGGTGPDSGGPTNADGEITFAWGPDDTVDDVEAWESRITIAESVPVGFVPPGPTVDCVLERPDQQNTTVSMDVVADSPDTSIERVVRYTFPNHVFLPGDVVRCELVSTPPAATTTVPESTTTVAETTTVPESTTTVADTTTVPETTTTTVEATTTTAAEATTTLAPLPVTVLDALEAAGDYTTFLSLVSQAPDVEALLEGDGPLTVFAPTDDALSGVTPPADPADLEELLLSHIVDDESLDGATLFDGRTEIDVATGGTQPVDADAGTVGGIEVSSADIASDAGFAHGVDGVLPVAAP